MQLFRAYIYNSHGSVLT